MDQYSSGLSVPDARDDKEHLEDSDDHQDIDSSIETLTPDSAVSKESVTLAADDRWSSPGVDNLEEDPKMSIKSQDIFMVHCNKIPGELHRAKFGGGSSGKCISMDGGQTFLTPKQFEAACGRASSKDWRGSIKFGSRSLKKLIKEKILIQHSSVCGCLICMDCSLGDKTRPPPPVRLFTPYKKRRARDSLSHLDKVPKKVVGNGGLTALNGMPAPGVTYRNGGLTALNGMPAPGGATYISDINQALGSSAVGTIVSAGGEQVFVLSVPTATTSQIETASLPSLPTPIESSGTNPSSIEATLKHSTEDTFKHLEDIANNLINKAVELKQLIADAREKTLHEIQSLGKKGERIDLIEVESGGKREEKRICIAQVGEPSSVVSVTEDLNIIGVLGSI